MTRVASVAGMLTLVTVALRITGAHAAIESHAGVLPCAGQLASSGVAPCHSTLTLSSVDAGFDARAEWLLSDAEPTESSIDISL